MKIILAAVIFVLVAAAMVVPPADVPATIPETCLVTAEGAGGCLVTCPQGDGDALSGIGGVITIVVVDVTGAPIPGIPASDFWLFGCSEQTVLCGGARSVSADSATGPQGQTTISGKWAAGGCDDGVLVIVQGWVIPDPADCNQYLCLPYTVRSPDITGNGGVTDLKVDIVDLAAFAAGFVSPPKPYQSCLDFDCNGLVDLVDFSIFALHYLHQC